MNNRTFILHIKEDKYKKMLGDYIFKYRHFENLYLIILKENQEDFNLLSNYEVMRAVLAETTGGNVKDKVKFIKDKYKNYDKMIELIRLSKSLKIHNISDLIKQVKSNYKSFFTKIKQKVKANTPSAKKLVLVTKYSILVDQIAFSFKKKDKIGINLSNKMFYIDFKHEFLPKNIQSLKIVYSNKEIYLHLNYLTEDILNSNLNIKEAGIDVGVNNLLAIFIDDKKSKSIIVDGTPFKKYNSKFNRFIAKLNESISNEVIEFKTSKTGTKYAFKWTQRGRELRKYKTFLYEKRNRYFYDQFHKVSKRVVEFLKLNSVTNLTISYNLASLKYNGDCKLNNKVKQNFIQIPFIKLLDYIQYKSNEVGIQVDIINEAYTSKCSCVSDDVNNPLDKELNGVRSKRGLFTDKLINKTMNADLNGAVNHIKKSNKNNDFSWLKNYMFKLCNPVKIKCDYDFFKFIKNSVFGQGMLSNNIQTSLPVQICAGLS
jgi:putative transposase